MNIPKEIEKYSAPEDKEILLGLFKHYHMRSNWFFVAAMKWNKYGKLSYECNRVWSPTKEGRVIYEHLIKGK